MQEDTKTRAFALARAAAEIDFDAALQGLLAGHDAKIAKLEAERAAADSAFLMALALGQKGQRIDPDGVMAKKIVDRLKAQKSHCMVEEKFLAEHS